MTFGIATVNPVMSIVFGVLIFLFPESLNYLVAIYLIIAGLVGLFGAF